MTRKQKLEIRRLQIVTRLNEIGDLEGDGYSDEVRTEESGLKTELRDLDGRLETAIMAEGEQETRARELFDNDGESAEVRALRGRVRVGAYLESVLEERALDGPEAELNAALKIPPGRFPMELLAPAPEVRATTDTDSATMQGTWLDRLFSETAAMALGISFRSVEPGISSYPVTTAGPSAAQRGRTEAAADAAWTVGVTEIKPTRNAVRVTFSEEDAARLPGLEQGLRRDMQSALTEGVDRGIYLGDDGATGTDADIIGLTTATGLTEKTLTQSNKVKAPNTLAAFAELVDGKHAASLGGLNVVASQGANTLWLSTIASAAADTKTIASFMMENGLRWSIRGDIEANTAANDWGAFIGRSRGIEGAGVAAIWNSGLFVRDPYTSAAKGEVALTLSQPSVGLRAAASGQLRAAQVRGVAMDGIERRAVEFRATAAGTIEGTLIPYGVASRIGGVFDEVFEPGSVRFAAPLVNVQHDRTRPLARLGHGLILTDSATALRAKIVLPDTTDGRDTRALIESGVLRGLSAEFCAVREDWPAPDRRVIHEAELRGLAVVDDPGHQSALIAEVRARLEAPVPGQAAKGFGCDQQASEFPHRRSWSSALSAVDLTD